MKGSNSQETTKSALARYSKLQNDIEKTSEQITKLDDEITKVTKRVKELDDGISMHAELTKERGERAVQAHKTMGPLIKEKNVQSDKLTSLQAQRNESDRKNKDREKERAKLEERIKKMAGVEFSFLNQGVLSTHTAKATVTSGGETKSSEKKAETANTKEIKDTLDYLYSLSKDLSPKVRAKFVESIEHHRHRLESLEVLNSHLKGLTESVANAEVSSNNKRSTDSLNKEITKVQKEIKSLIDADYKEMVKAVLISKIIQAAAPANIENGLEEGLKGAHFKVKGEKARELYEQLKEISAERTSSHYKELVDKPKSRNTRPSFKGINDDVTKHQSILGGRVYKEFLFGIVEKEGDEPFLWFQTEGNPHHRNYTAEKKWESIVSTVISIVAKVATLGIGSYNLDKFRHHLDFLKYKFYYNKKQNVGQYGDSAHTELNEPIELTLDDKKVKEIREEIKPMLEFIKGAEKTPEKEVAVGKG